MNWLHNSPLKGIGVRDFYQVFIGDFSAMPVFTRCWSFLIVFWYLIFSYKEKIVRFVRRCFGRLDGSIRALRKVRFRNEIDNFIESMSQMVPRWSPEVPDGPQRSPKPITSCGRSPKPTVPFWPEMACKLACLNSSSKADKCGIIC